jgi:hypothetical protein
MRAGARGHGGGAVNTPTDPIRAAEYALRQYAPLDAIDTYAAAIFEHDAAETATVLRCIGLMLMRERRPDRWREAYQAYLASIWPDKDYVDGDETRFLHRSGSLPE